VEVWVIFFNSMRKYKTPKTRVPLEVLQKKHGVGLQLHLFLGTEFLELKVFGNAELERSCKNRSGAVPNIPLT
jgi:hypothetical protein